MERHRYVCQASRPSFRRARGYHERWELRGGLRFCYQGFPSGSTPATIGRTPVSCRYVAALDFSSNPFGGHSRLRVVRYSFSLPYICRASSATFTGRGVEPRPSLWPPIKEPEKNQQITILENYCRYSSDRYPYPFRPNISYLNAWILMNNDVFTGFFRAPFRTRVCKELSVYTV